MGSYLLVETTHKGARRQRRLLGRRLRSPSVHPVLDLHLALDGEHHGHLLLKQLELVRLNFLTGRLLETQVKECALPSLDLGVDLRHGLALDVGGLKALRGRRGRGGEEAGKTGGEGGFAKCGLARAWTCKQMDTNAKIVTF